MTHAVKGTHVPLMQRSAVISSDGRYRYTLSRTWGYSDEGPYVAWVMLNPSTADAEVDDPTIRRCISFTADWGFTRLVVVNLFALRSPDPKALLLTSFEDAVGPTNDQHIRQVTKGASITVCAWGAHKMVSRRADQVRAILTYPMCLGLTKDGSPRHPLYVPSATKLRLLP